MRGIRLVAVGSLVAMLSSCSQQTQGPIHTICGQKLSIADVQITPWYYDSSSRSLDIALPAPLPNETGDGVWVRISRNCSGGTMVHVSPGSVIRIEDSVKSKDGGFVAVFLSPLASGSAVVRFFGSDKRAHRLTITVRPNAPTTG